ncbi:uncharacterized protein LOC118416698 isoform X3 [Branchiostoma floridae]|uniref:Uncharacterized protein LOC118416698 isoform X3 n=1 Tax=Branchiostoma floridae TaxID=7739 RepID=A0A9J7MS58_BRAFL|nr:uncharacterized protein LOC118416698 isoform X3 [Branchiostoma floridae]
MANLFEKLSLPRHDQDSDSSGNDKDGTGDKGNHDSGENTSVDSDTSRQSENNMEDEGSMGEGEEETLFEEEGETPTVPQEDPARIFEAMKSFTIPRKRSVQKELLEDISLTSREFTHELLPQVSLCYRDPAMKNKIKHLKIYMVHNQELSKEFHEKRREMKGEGRTDKDLAEQLGFLCLDTFEDAQKVCQTGLTVGSSFLSSLGHPNMGVYVSRYADIIKPGPLINGTKGFLIIFKVIKGKMKSVVENNSWNFTEPTPNFDCHVSKAVAEIGSLQPNQAFHAAQYYLYEFGDLDMLKRPRHVLPYAVVQFEVFGGSQTFPLMASSAQTRLPQRPHPSYPPVSTPRPSSMSHVGPSYASYPSAQMIEVARRPQIDLTEEGYELWRGQLVNKENPLCEIQLRSPTCTLLPIQMEQQICISGRIPFHKLQKNLPCPIFTKLPKVSTHREVHIGDKYFIYCEVKAIIDVENKLVSLLNFMEKRKEACVAVLPDGVQLLMFPSCQMAQDLGIIDPSSPMVLHGLFVSPSPMLASLRDCSLRKNIKAPVDGSSLYGSPSPATPSSSAAEADSPKTPKVDTTELRSAMMQVFELQKMQAEGNMTVQDSIQNLERQNQLLRNLQAKVEVHSKTLAEAQQKKVLQETDAFDNTDFTVPKYPIVSRLQLEQCFTHQYSFTHRWQLELQRRQHQPANMDPRLAQVPAFPLQQHSGQPSNRMGPTPSPYPHQMYPLGPHSPHPQGRNMPLLGTPNQSSVPGSMSAHPRPPMYPLSSYGGSVPTPSGSTPPQLAATPSYSPSGASPFLQQPASGPQGSSRLGKFPLSSLPPNQKANDPRLRKHLEAMQPKVPAMARTSSLPSAQGSTPTTTAASPLLNSPLITASSPLLASEKTTPSDSPTGVVSMEKVPPARSHSLSEHLDAPTRPLPKKKEPPPPPKVQEVPVSAQAQEETDKSKVPDAGPTDKEKPSTKASGIAKGKDAALQPKAGVVSNIPLEEKEEMKAFLDTVIEETQAESKISSASEMKNFLDTVVIGKPQKKKPLKEKEKVVVTQKKMPEKRKERLEKERLPEKKRIRMPEEDIIKRCMLPSISNLTIPRKKPAQQEKPSVVEYNHGAGSTTIDYQHGSSSGPKISPVSKVVDYGHGRDKVEQSVEEEEDADIRMQAIVVDYGHQPPATNLIDTETLTTTDTVSTADGSTIMDDLQHPPAGIDDKVMKEHVQSADLAQPRPAAATDAKKPMPEQEQFDSNLERQMSNEVEPDEQESVVEESEEELTEDFLFCRDVSYGATNNSLTVTVRTVDDEEEDGTTVYDGLTDSEALELSVVRAVFSHYYLGDLDLQENGEDFAEHVRNSIHAMHTTNQEVSTADRHVVENADAAKEKEDENTSVPATESTNKAVTDSKIQDNTKRKSATLSEKATSSFKLRGKNYYEPSQDLGVLMKDLTSPSYKRSAAHRPMEVTVSELVPSPTKKFGNCSEKFRHSKNTKDSQELDHTAIHADKEAARKHSENSNVQQMLRLLDDDLKSHQQEEGQQEQDLYKAYEKEQDEQKVVIPGLGAIDDQLKCLQPKGDDDLHVANTGHSWLRAAGMGFQCQTGKFEEDLTLSTTQGAQRSGLLRSTASAMLDPRLSKKLCKQKQGSSSRCTKTQQREPCDLPLPKFAEDVMHWLKEDLITGTNRLGFESSVRTTSQRGHVETDREMTANADSAHRQKDISPLLNVDGSTGSRTKESQRISLSEVKEKVSWWLEKFGPRQQPREPESAQERAETSSAVSAVDSNLVSLAPISESAAVSETVVHKPEVEACKEHLLAKQQAVIPPEETATPLLDIKPTGVTTGVEKSAPDSEPTPNDQTHTCENIQISAPPTSEATDVDLPQRVKLEPVRVEYRSGVVKRSSSSSPVAVTVSSPVHMAPTPLSPTHAPVHPCAPVSPATTVPPQAVSSTAPEQNVSLPPPGLVIPSLSLVRVKQETTKALEQPCAFQAAAAVTASTTVVSAESVAPAVKQQVKQEHVTVEPVAEKVTISEDKALQAETSISVSAEEESMSKVTKDNIIAVASTETVDVKDNVDANKEKKEAPTVVEASPNKVPPKQPAIIKSPAEIIAGAAASKPVKPVVARKPTIAELVVTRLMKEKAGKKAGKKGIKKGSRASSPVFEAQGKVLKKPGTITIANLKQSPVAGSKAAVGKSVGGKIKSPGKTLAKVQSNAPKNAKDVIKDAYDDFEKEVSKTLEEKGLSALAVSVSEDSQGTKDVTQVKRLSRLARFSRFYLSCKHDVKYPDNVRETLVDADYAIRHSERQITRKMQMEMEKERHKQHFRDNSSERTHSIAKGETASHKTKVDKERKTPGTAVTASETGHMWENKRETCPYQQDSMEAVVYYAMQNLRKKTNTLHHDSSDLDPLPNAVNLSFTKGKHLKLSKRSAGNVDYKMATRIDDVVMDSLVPLPLPGRYAPNIPLPEDKSAPEVHPTPLTVQGHDQPDTVAETPDAASAVCKVETAGDVPELADEPETSAPPSFMRPLKAKLKPIVINIKTKTCLDPALPQWTKVSGAEVKPQTSPMYEMPNRKSSEEHQFHYLAPAQSVPPPGIDQPIVPIPGTSEPIRSDISMPQTHGVGSEQIPSSRGSWTVPGWGMTEQCPPWYSQPQSQYIFTSSAPKLSVPSSEPPPPGVDDGGDSPLLDEGRYMYDDSSTKIDRIIDEVDRDFTKVFGSSVETAGKEQVQEDVRKVEFRDGPDVETTTAGESSGPHSNVEALVNQLIAAGRSAADRVPDKADNTHTEFLYGEYGTPIAIKPVQNVSSSLESGQQHGDEQVKKQWESLPYQGEFSLHVDHEATDEIVVDLLKDFFDQISDTLESCSIPQAGHCSQQDMPGSSLRDQGSHLPALSRQAVAMVRGNKRHAEMDLSQGRHFKWQRFHSNLDYDSDEAVFDVEKEEHAEHFRDHLNQLSRHCSKESHSKLDAVTKGSYLATKTRLVEVAGSPLKQARDRGSASETEEGHLGGSVRFMNLSTEARERILQARARTAKIVNNLMTRYSNEIQDVAEDDHETFKKLSKRQKKNLKKRKQRGSKSEKANVPLEVSYASPITSDSDTELILAQSPDRESSPPPLPADPTPYGDKSADHQQQEAPPSSSAQNWFYVYNPHSDAALQEVKDFLLSAGGTELDPFNLTLVADIPGVDVWVVIRNSDTPDVANIPNLYELKRMPMVKFVGLDSIDDLRNQTYCHIFTRGAIVVPDEKVIIKASSGELQALCQFMEEQTFDKDEPWTMKLHYSTRLSLEKMKNDITLDYTEREDAWKMLCCLDEYIRKGMAEYLPLLHGCKDGDKSPGEMLPCVAKIQLENLETCRHIVMLTDLDQSSEQAGIFWKAGIGVTSLKEFLSVFTSWKGEQKDKGKESEVKTIFMVTSESEKTEHAEVSGRAGNLIEISTVPGLNGKGQEEKTEEGEEVQGKPIPSIGSATNHRPPVPYNAEDFSEGHAELPVTSSQTDFGETAEHQQYLETVSSQLQASPHVSPGAKVVPVAGQPSCHQSSVQGQAATTPHEVAHPQVHLSPVPQEAPHTQPPQPHPSPQQPLNPSPYPVQSTQPPQSPHTHDPAYPASSTQPQSFTPQLPHSQAMSYPQQSPVLQTAPSPSYLPQSPYPPQSAPYSSAYQYPQQPPSPMVSVNAESSPQAQPSPHTQSFSPYPPYYSPQPQGAATPGQPGYPPHFQFPESYPEMHGPPQMHCHPGPEYYMGPPPPGMGPPHHPGMAPHPRGPFVQSPQPYSGPPLTPGGGAESDHSLSPGVDKETKPVEKKGAPRLHLPQGSDPAFQGSCRQEASPPPTHQSPASNTYTHLTQLVIVPECTKCGTVYSIIYVVNIQCHVYAIPGQT